METTQSESERERERVSKKKMFERDNWNFLEHIFLKKGRREED